MNENRKHLIEAGCYEGYLWYSDQASPVIYDGDNKLTHLELDDESNPFVVEGQLYDREKDLSYSIRYADGRYTVAVCTHEERTSAADCRQEYYLRKRMDGRVLCLLELWQEEADQACANMNVLRLKRIVFNGFKK